MYSVSVHYRHWRRSPAQKEHSPGATRDSGSESDTFLEVTEW